jgi:hypothetical protein
MFWHLGAILTVYSNIYRTRCNVTQFILSRNCSTCFGWYHHPSSGVQTTVSTASGICHAVTAICRYRGRVGTGFSVLWVADANHSTLKRCILLDIYWNILTMHGPINVTSPNNTNKWQMEFNSVFKELNKFTPKFSQTLSN